MKINLRGLVNKEMTGKMLLDQVCRIYENSNSDDWLISTMKQRVEDNMIDDDFLQVDEKLEKICGVYPLEATDVTWSRDFYDMLYSWMYRVNDTINKQCLNKRRGLETDIESLFAEKARFDLTNLDEVARNTYELEDIVKSIRYADYQAGTTVDKHGRKVKILKYLTKSFAPYLNFTNQDYEQMNWYQYYNKCKNSNTPLYLVITNSVASHLGMSAYSPMKGNPINNQRVWSSCQNAYENAGSYARGLLPNLTDRGSVVAYITTGNVVDYDRIYDYEHYEMITRYMIRLLKSEDGGFYVVLDRAYPNARYTNNVLSKLIEICNKKDLQVGFFSNYNSSQAESYHPGDAITDKIKRWVESSYRIYSFYKEMCNDCRECEGCHSFTTRMCHNCSPVIDDVCDDCSVREQNHCSRCNNFDINECNGQDCSSCTQAPCHFDLESYEEDEGPVYCAHYDDQNGTMHASRAENFNSDDGSYKFGYTIHVGLNDLIFEDNNFRKKEAIDEQ